uniref:Uncharacterized protein n=1 Tax=Chromera velia CCMP2878 TaxID=1169474 RepID=A0A0G4HK77_9ALVE|eukprot:Cvel_7167.t1-p1 / transcript=Cvel_7167.t1 / gene=Cvel_7167 / organism=Chromera_velia_CCMP2878 / gene_product=hypothetical protein / transcript_product=hypothetical protein / location=Cvel_scaffold369:2704-11293(+) / protein_length=225 / sequence_SO=supercontig / SO=protein_coding / is_pseudo=false
MQRETKRKGGEEKKVEEKGKEQAPVQVVESDSELDIIPQKKRKEESKKKKGGKVIEEKESDPDSSEDSSDSSSSSAKDGHHGPSYLGEHALKDLSKDQGDKMKGLHDDMSAFSSFFTQQRAETGGLFQNVSTLTSLLSAQGGEVKGLQVDVSALFSLLTQQSGEVRGVQGKVSWLEETQLNRLKHKYVVLLVCLTLLVVALNIGIIGSIALGYTVMGFRVRVCRV